MFSTTIKRSVATLGVVAGLLAAAVPASAAGPAGVMPDTGQDALKAPTRADDQVKVSGYTYNPKEIGIDNLRGEAIDIIP